MSEPLYTATNSRVAYQLRWSLTLFAEQAWPAIDEWRESLAHAVVADCVRLLEFRLCGARAGQFFVSTQPDISPSQVVRSVKGRLQYLVRDAMPRFWRRHYSIASVGDANSQTLHRYVARQVQHHPLVDLRAVDRLSQFQFHDPGVDLAELRASGHGKFTHNLHIVLENKEHLCDTRDAWLEASRAMLIAASRKKGWLLARIGLVGNHLHALVGCGVAEVPRDVALSMMNNLAFTHGMKPVYEYSFYIGTFGPYDNDAIRHRPADVEVL